MILKIDNYHMKKLVVIAAFALLVLGCSTDNILSYADQLKKDVAAIDKYLDKNGITNVVIDSLTGMRLVIEDAGSGIYPVLTSKLTVLYTGKFLNGEVFDQSTLNASGAPVAFTTPLSGLIEGWKIGFGTYVGKGGKATFYIPSGLAYGNSPPNGFPANANLIFEVELIGFTN